MKLLFLVAAILLLSAYSVVATEDVKEDAEPVDVKNMAEILPEGEGEIGKNMLRSSCTTGYCGYGKPKCCSGYYCPDYHGSYCKKRCTTGYCGHGNTCCSGYFCGSDYYCKRTCKKRKCKYNSDCCHGWFCNKRGRCKRNRHHHH